MSKKDVLKSTSEQEFKLSQLQENSSSKPIIELINKFKFLFVSITKKLKIDLFKITKGVKNKRGFWTKVTLGDFSMDNSSSIKDSFW